MAEAALSQQPALNSNQAKLSTLYHAISSHIIGQAELLENMMVCLLANGHLLLEGLPGLAKTTAAKAMATGIDAEFHRIQFTPDLLPSDVIGTEMYRHEQGDFTFRKGPVFHNIVLADEINRAPAKVQSALLEAMEERQVTVGNTTYKLPDLFMVIATQNPIEQEGTYRLPEAQLDRFLMNVIINYPTPEEEQRILALDDAKRKNTFSGQKPVIATTSQAEILEAQKQTTDVHLDEKLSRYIVSLVTATREAKPYSEEAARWIRYGASPRASLALARCSRALAWLRGSDFVTPEHIQSVALPILRHRIILSFDAEAEGISKDKALKTLIEAVAVP